MPYSGVLGGRYRWWVVGGVGGKGLKNSPLLSRLTRWPQLLMVLIREEQIFVLFSFKVVGLIVKVVAIRGKIILQCC